MDPTLDRMLDEDMLIPLTAIICGSVIAVIAIIFTQVRAMVVSRNKELTKRELAAYVAEGSLDPDKAVSMINAGRPHWEAGHGGEKGKCA